MKSNKVMITCCLVGGGTTRKQSPYLPLTPEELASDAVKAVKAGASILHIHARDEEGKNTMETERMCQVVRTIEQALLDEGLDAIINITSSGTKFSEDLRVAHLPILLPEMTSYDPGTLNWANSYIFLNTPQFLERLGTLTQEIDVKPELEIFDAGMLGNVKYYYKKGFLKDPLHFQLVLGVPGGMDGTVENIAYLVSHLPEGATWSITGIGKSHMPCMLAGLAAGCDGLRVGLEDNVNLYKGVLATNEQLVQQAVAMAKLAGREIATAAEAREILSIKRKWQDNEICGWNK
ncbi:MAG: 3-keto-5-aminohexanoate cleavage protein [Clostridia bacterium]|nr:3-keto-5-aminohexanoate cleavage protein [Clostridia bacterium]